MDTASFDNHKAQVALTRDEILIVNNALNEVCNALDAIEFSTRMGLDIENVQALLKQFGDLYDRMASR